MLEIEQSSFAEVVYRQCDVSDYNQLQDLLGESATGRLRGVFHLAGVLDDGLLREQTLDRFDRVLAAKALGAWNLHELTRDSELEQFVLFSSLASIVGSPGQANYAAANAFLDALAHHRRFLSLPALSVNWGSWEDAGMAARLKEREGQRWEAAGVGWIGIRPGLQTLEELLANGTCHASVAPIDWTRFASQLPGPVPCFLQGIVEEIPADAGGSGESPVLLEQTRNLTSEECAQVAQQHLIELAARVLAWNSSVAIDPNRPFNELGFDSLTGVEFCNAIGRAIGQSFSPTILYDYPTINRLTEYVVAQLTPSGVPASAVGWTGIGTEAARERGSPEPVSPEPVSPEPVSPEPVSPERGSPESGRVTELEPAERRRILEEVEQLSEAEMEALIEQQLQALKSK
jgi:acyl carrier protein